MSTQAHTPTRSSFPIIVALIGIFLIFWFLTSKVYVDQEEAAAPAAVERPSLVERNGAAREMLNNNKALDLANGKVRLKIERAMTLVIAENAD